MKLDARLRKAIDGNRLRRDIEENAEFGKVETETGHGRTVLPGTEPNREARDRLVTEFRAAGLDVRVDPVGTIAGRYQPPNLEADARPVASGSHLDSVPYGGIFDGPLGVYGALEAVRAIDAAGIELNRPIEVVSFTEEEGHRFTDGLLGSSVSVGEADPDTLLQLTDKDGITLEESLESIGYRGDAVVDASSWDSWLELHIEQSEYLSTSGYGVGVVTSIAGTIRCTVTIEGEANHSGTTGMDERTDALIAASELTIALEEFASDLAEQDGGETVATVGQLDVDPGAVNVVPGTVTMRLDIRSTDAGNIKSIFEFVTERLESLEETHEVETTIERPYDVPPTAMSPRCREALLTAADDAEIRATELHSGAGHDTMKIANVTDAGMLFAPSEDGISHHPGEWTDWDDCLDSVRVLAGAIARLARSG